MAGEFFFGWKALPRAHRAQDQVGVAFVDSHGFGGKVGPTDLDDYVGYFGKAAQPLFNALADFDRIGERNPRQLARFNENRALVEPRHELRAYEKQRTEGDRQENDCGTD